MLEFFDGRLVYGGQPEDVVTISHRIHREGAAVGGIELKFVGERGRKSRE